MSPRTSLSLELAATTPSSPLLKLVAGSVMMSVVFSVNCASIYESLAVGVNGFRGHQIE